MPAWRVPSLLEPARHIAPQLLTVPKVSLVKKENESAERRIKGTYNNNWDAHEP